MGYFDLYFDMKEEGSSKSKLQQLCSERGYPSPKYHFSQTTYIDGKVRFRGHCKCNEAMADGYGTSREWAEEHAASNMLGYFKNEVSEVIDINNSSFDIHITFCCEYFVEILTKSR